MSSTRSVSSLPGITKPTQPHRKKSLTRSVLPPLTKVNDAGGVQDGSPPSPQSPSKMGAQQAASITIQSKNPKFGRSKVVHAEEKYDEKFTDQDFVNARTYYLQFATVDEPVPWESVSEMARLMGIKADQAMHNVFKKQDKDRTGTNSFLHALHCLFPQHTLRDMQRVQKRVVAAEEQKRIQMEEANKDWRDKFDRQSLEELAHIFKIYASSGMSNPDAMDVDPDVLAKSNGIGIALHQLLTEISPSVMEPQIIEELFKQHDEDGDNKLNFMEFASLMEDTYMRDRNKRPPVTLYFQ